MKLRTDLPVERLREVLHYDRVTGAFIWRVQLGSRGVVGTRAGCVRKDGYRTISVDGCTYLAHRLAWRYVTGEWPEIDVDHRNLTPGDDRWRNLRAATRSQNKANVGLSHANTSGYKGVSWSKKDRRWRVLIKAEGKTKFLGNFLTKEAAHAAYVAAAMRRFGEFARAA